MKIHADAEQHIQSTDSKRHGSGKLVLHMFVGNLLMYLLPTIIFFQYVCMNVAYGYVFTHASQDGKSKHTIWTEKSNSTRVEGVIMLLSVLVIPE